MNRHAVALALLSAALFGVSTPAAKALLGVIDPAVLAGLLYCGAGFGVALLRRLVGPLLGERRPSQAPVGRADFPWLAGAVVAGGIVGPILLMLGLVRTDAATASLLLTMEGVASALLAWFVFHENFDRRITGMACLVAGAVVLSWSGTPSLQGLLGPLAIIGACLAWGLDNNLTRKVSLADPLQIVEIKGLIAGPINLLIGLSAGGSLPATFSAMLIAGLVGFIGYGVSLALFVLALRDLGTARTGAYFSTAPFLGAIAALIFLHEPLTLQLLAAGLLMALGVWLHLTETHEHEHEHELVEHAHAHVHDEHHRHEHSPADPLGEPHTHKHKHIRLRHRHPHVPDMHHTHRH